MSCVLRSRARSAGGRWSGQGDHPPARDLGADVLPLWTALPLQVDLALSGLVSCKQLSGVTLLAPGCPNGESARARLYSW